MIFFYPVQKLISEICYFFVMICRTSVLLAMFAVSESSKLKTHSRIEGLQNAKSKWRFGMHRHWCWEKTVNRGILKLIRDSWCVLPLPFLSTQQEEILIEFVLCVCDIGVGHEFMADTPWSMDAPWRGIVRSFVDTKRYEVDETPLTPTKNTTTEPDFDGFHTCYSIFLKSWHCSYLKTLEIQSRSMLY